MTITENAADIITSTPALAEEAAGWAMDAYDLDFLPTTARAVQFIRNGYAGGLAEFVRNSSALISN